MPSMYVEVVFTIIRGKKGNKLNYMHHNTHIKKRKERAKLHQLFGH